jgi:hypothetical protein
MLHLASFLLLPVALSNPADKPTASYSPEAAGYYLCVPWAMPAEPLSWAEVIAYYTNPPFRLPAQPNLLPPLAGGAGFLAPTVLVAVNGQPEAWEAVSNGPRKLKKQIQGDWGSLQSQMTIQDIPPAISWQDPMRKRQWQTDEAWRYSVLGPFSLYGQVATASEEAQQQDVKVGGKTGLACSLPTGIPQAAVTLRTGPAVAYTDALRPERMRERAEWVLEVEGRLPLVAGIGVEFQSAALPALNPLDRDRFTQDVRLAYPMGSAGKLTVGAKRLWEGGTDPRTGTESRQLYLGFEIQR